MVHFLKGFPLLALALLAGCYAMPAGPTVTALPGDAKSPDEFRTNDRDCRQYAVDGRGPTVAGGRPGSVIDGIDSAQFAGYGLQQRYNRAYFQCMYLKGNNVTLLARERWPAPRSPWPPDPDAYYSPVQR